VEANAYSVMGGFLRAEGPDEKLAYLRAHPELDDLTNRAALDQMIEEAQEAGDGDRVRFLRSHLMLLDAAVMTSPEEAVNRAFRRG
jgi:methyl coenzyme M reductase gamma subunit